MPARFFLDGCKTELQPVKIGFPYFFLRGIFLRCVFAVINVRMVFLDGCKTELQPVKYGSSFFFLRCVFAVINVRYDFFLDGCKTELQPVNYRFFGLFFDADGCDMCEKLMWLCISYLFVSMLPSNGNGDQFIHKSIQVCTPSFFFSLNISSFCILLFIIGCLLILISLL